MHESHAISRGISTSGAFIIMCTHAYSRYSIYIYTVHVYTIVEGIVISELIFQSVRQKYQQWTEDIHNLEIYLKDDSAITLDLQEQEVDPWKIIPLAESQVKLSQGNTICTFGITVKEAYNHVHIINVIIIVTLQITKEAVTMFKKGERIPHCAFQFQLLEGRSPQQLFHRVNLIGGLSSSSEKCFYICYPQSKRK